MVDAVGVLHVAHGPAARAEAAADGAHVAGGRAEGEDRQLGPAQRGQAQRIEALLHRAPRREHALGHAQIARMAQVVHHRPGRGDGAARARAHQRVGEVLAARPVVEVVAHQREGLGVGEEQGRGALGGVAVLVQVGRDRGHALDREIEVGDVGAELARERREVAAHAGIDMHPAAVLARQRRDLGNGVDHAMRKGRRRAHHHRGVGREGGAHRRRVGAEVGRQRRAHWQQAEEVRGLVEGRVRALRHQDFGLRHAGAARQRAVARALDREEDALGAAGGHGAARLGTAVQQRKAHLHHLALEGREAREGARAQAVLGEVHQVGLLGHLEHVLARVVDEHRHATVAPVGVAAAGLLEPPLQLGPGRALLGECQCHGRFILPCRPSGRPCFRAPAPAGRAGSRGSP